VTAGTVLSKSVKTPFQIRSLGDTGEIVTARNIISKLFIFPEFQKAGYLYFVPLCALHYQA